VRNHDALSARADQLARYLERCLDEERTAVAEELHDGLGGLLVAAKMDLSHIEHALGAERTEVRARLAQMRENLDAAITTERRMVEQLRPGLLVHLGLFAALRWYVEDLSVRTGRACLVRVPEKELALSQSTRVSLYRAVVEAFTLGYGNTRLEADLVDESLRLAVTRLHVAADAAADADLRLLAIRHRVKTAGGALTVKTEPDGSLSLLAISPLSASRPEEILG
jgi:two-component system, NarL family, sensor histidine kinase UhpB